MLIYPDAPPPSSTPLISHHMVTTTRASPQRHPRQPLPSPHPHLHSMYAPLCPSCHNSVVLYLELALLSSLSCVFLLVPVCVCAMSTFCVCMFMSHMPTTASLPVTIPPDSDFPYSPKPTPLLLHIFLPSKLRGFQCMISTACTGAFKPSPLHYNPATLRYSLPPSISVSFSSPTSSTVHLPASATKSFTTCILYEHGLHK